MNNKCPNCGYSALLESDGSYECESCGYGWFPKTASECIDDLYSDALEVLDEMQKSTSPDQVKWCEFAKMFVEFLRTH